MSVKDTFRVNSGFGDPVEGDVNLATYKGNALYGYYGFTRKDKYGRIKTPHRGFDYATTGEMNVFAVGDGYIKYVRFGRPNVKKHCAFREIIQGNSFKSSVCYKDDNNKCNNCDDCYGVQVWLKLDDTKYYAYYAHLSELSPKVLEKIPENFNGDTIEINLHVEKDFPIGKSGRTGNASTDSYPDHLHFECRTGKETGTQICPNFIVHTQFKIVMNAESVFNEDDEELVLPYHKKQEHEMDFLPFLEDNEKEFRDLDKNYIYLLKKWKILRDNIRKWDISKSNQKYAKKATMSVSEMVIPILDFELVNHPKEQCLDSYETITNTTEYNLEDVSNEKNRSIEPYQIIKKTKMSFSTKRGLSHTYGVDEYDVVEDEIKTCSNPTNQMPWQSK